MQPRARSQAPQRRPRFSHAAPQHESDKRLFDVAVPSPCAFLLSPSQRLSAPARSQSAGRWSTNVKVARRRSGSPSPSKRHPRRLPKLLHLGDPTHQQDLSPSEVHAFLQSDGARQVAALPPHLRAQASATLGLGVLGAPAAPTKPHPVGGIRAGPSLMSVSSCLDEPLRAPSLSTVTLQLEGIDAHASTYPSLLSANSSQDGDSIVLSSMAEGGGPGASPPPATSVGTTHRLLQRLERLPAAGTALLARPSSKRPSSRRHQYRAASPMRLAESRPRSISACSAASVSPW